MKKLFLFASIFLFAITRQALSQQAYFETFETKDPSTFKLFPVNIDTKKKYTVATHFKYVAIIDNRDDQFKLGLTRAGEKPEDRRIVFPAEFQNYVGEKINKLIRPDSLATDTIVYAINDLWLYQTLSPASFLAQNLLGSSNNLISNCYLNIEAYAKKNDEYILLCEIDTLLRKQGWLPNQCDHLVSSAFSLAVAFSDSVFARGVTSTPALTDSQLNYVLKKQLDYPILNAETNREGIFETYQDFLQNHLLAMKTEVYYKNKRRFARSSSIPDSVLLNKWGFCDGKDLFMNINGSFYKLKKVSNTFSLTGPRIIEYKTTNFNRILNTATSYFLLDPHIIDPFDFVGPSSQKIELLAIYHLDIRTGILR
jgi:hypothetical protein